MGKIQLSNRETEFFNKLYLDNFQEISRYISLATRNRLSGEDISQEVFFIAARKIDCLMKHNNPKGWLYNTAKNLIMDAFKKKALTAEIPISHEELGKYADRTTGYQNLEDIFDDYREILNDDEVYLLKQHIMEGYKITEIAQMRNKSSAAMNMKFSKIYKKMKNLKKYCFLVLLFCTVNQYYI